MLFIEFMDSILGTWFVFLTKKKNIFFLLLSLSFSLSLSPFLSLFLSLSFSFSLSNLNFLFKGTISWNGMISLNLILSLRNPFVYSAQYLKLYHFYVWSLSSSLTLLMAVSGAFCPPGDCECRWWGFRGQGDYRFFFVLFFFFFLFFFFVFFFFCFFFLFFFLFVFLFVFLFFFCLFFFNLIFFGV